MSERAGMVVDGKYELIEKVGEGGMAVVWRAVMHGAAGFSRPVAVKKIKHEFRASDRYIRMFVEEARVGSELAHPNIVQVLDFCTDESGSYYLIMEWVEGLDLAAFVNSFARAGDKAPWPLVVAIGIGALRGLAAAHERRRDDGTAAPVIHRDVSPHNILLAGNGIVKLTDFGLARARDRIDSLTAPGTVKGKIAYWSPEIAGGGEASVASDLFAMAVVLWESLAAERLFDGATDVEVFRKIYACKVKPLDERRNDLPPRLSAVLYEALDAKPENRFASARDMAAQLADVLKKSATADAHNALSEEVIRARHRLGGRYLPRNTPPGGLPVSGDLDGESIDIQFSDAERERK